MSQYIIKLVKYYSYKLLEEDYSLNIKKIINLTLSLIY